MAEKTTEEGSKHSSTRNKTPNPFKSCPICGKNLKNKIQFEDHQNIHTGERPFQCELCGKYFGSRDVLRCHRQQHNIKRRFTCDTCGKSFQQKVGLENHIRTHTGERPFECGLCGKTFARKGQADAKRHACIVIKAKVYKCDECTFSSASMPELKTHKRRVHENTRNGLLYRCELCQKEFKYKHSLKLHEKIHTGIPKSKTYLCNFCGKSFAEKRVLTEHERIHTGVKPFLCNVCGKAFSQKSTLRRHNSVHTGIKPYCCEKCGIQFLAPSLLQKHGCQVRPHEVVNVELKIDSGSVNTNSDAKTSVKKKYVNKSKSK